MDYVISECADEHEKGKGRWRKREGERERELGRDCDVFVLRWAFCENEEESGGGGGVRTYQGRSHWLTVVEESM